MRSWLASGLSLLLLPGPGAAAPQPKEAPLMLVANMRLLLVLVKVRALLQVRLGLPGWCPKRHKHTTPEAAHGCLLLPGVQTQMGAACGEVAGRWESLAMTKWGLAGMASRHQRLPRP